MMELDFRKVSNTKQSISALLGELVVFTAVYTYEIAYSIDDIAVEVPCVEVFTRSYRPPIQQVIDSPFVLLRFEWFTQELVYVIGLHPDCGLFVTRIKANQIAKAVD